MQGVLVGLDPHMVSGQETGGAITESRFRFDPSDSAYSIIFDFYDPFDGSALGVDNGAFTVGTDLNAPSGALANVATGSNQHEALLMSCMNPLVALRNQFMSGLAMILERHPDTRTKSAYYMLPSRTNAQPASVAALPIVEQRPRTALTYRDPLDRNRSYRVPTASVPVNSAGPELLSVVGNSADAEYWLRRNAQYCYHMYGGSMAERVNPVTGTRVRVGLNPLIDNIGFEPSGVTPRTNFPAPSGIYSWAPVNGMDDGFLASEVFAIVGTVQSDPAALSIGTAYEPWNPASGAPARADSLRADLPAFLNFTINAYVGAGSDLSNPAVILFLVMPPHPAENAAILAAVQQINATGRQVVVVYAPASLRDCAQWSDLAQNAFNVDLSGTGASRNSFLLLAPSDTTDPTNTVYCRCPTSLGFTADDQCMRWYWHRVIANSGIPGNQNSIQGQVLNLVYSDIFEMHKRL